VAVSEAEALRTFPELITLRTLKAAGWKFRTRLDEADQLVGIDGWHDWPGGWRDGLGIRSSTDACGIRKFGDDLVWDFSGTLSDVLAELLVLPRPGDRTAPRLVVGSAPVLWTP
jgi:hypothetical protein